MKVRTGFITSLTGLLMIIVIGFNAIVCALSSFYCIDFNKSSFCVDFRDEILKNHNFTHKENPLFSWSDPPPNTAAQHFVFLNSVLAGLATFCIFITKSLYNHQTISFKIVDYFHTILMSMLMGLGLTIQIINFQTHSDYFDNLNANAKIEIVFGRTWKTAIAFLALNIVIYIALLILTYKHYREQQCMTQFVKDTKIATVVPSKTMTVGTVKRLVPIDSPPLTDPTQADEIKTL